MLHSLRGTLLQKDNDLAVVDVNGLRFEVEIPGSTAEQLPEPGNAAELFTRLSLNVNEGTFTLFGFATLVERECFEVLTGITGIGPRKALMILSQIEIGSFARAILAQDITAISKIKGVGQKTAERLVLELREKVASFAAQRPDEPPPLAGKQNLSDAMQALMALGTRPHIAERAIRSAAEALGEDARVEDLVREGLKRRA